MNTRICKKCNLNKSISEFDVYKNSSGEGIRGTCHVCLLKQQTASRNKTLEKSRKREKIWVKNNKRKVAGYKKKYVKDNPDRVKKSKQKYNNENKEKIACRRKNNIQYRIASNLRKRMGRAISGNFKSGSAVSDLGCSIVELKKYLEKRFYSNPRNGENMSWNNWARDGWHIDHIIPLNSFNLSDKKQFLKACHYTNLQPLWYFDNLSKGSKTRNEDV